MKDAMEKLLGMDTVMASPRKFSTCKDTNLKRIITNQMLPL